MARPRCYRRIGEQPNGCLFKPAGIPTADLEHVQLSAEELEAIRLADDLRLYQTEAAEQMGISRQTFGRTLAVARRKIARVLVHGLALQIEAGDPELMDKRRFQCDDCGHLGTLDFGTGAPGDCPNCQGKDMQRLV